MLGLTYILALLGCSSATPPATELAPAPSAGHSMTYHAGLQSVVMVNTSLGGMGSPPVSTKTILWRWTGSAWEILDSNGPPVRNLGGFAYDSHRNVLVMYGGSYDLDNMYDETWEWSQPGGWVNRNAGAPGKRDHTDMVYDAERRRMVLYGGQIGTSTFPATTWTWDGATWQEHAVSGPGPRIHHSMVYDPATKRVLLFGGRIPNGGGTQGDTWAWDGSGWTNAATATTARSHARIGLTSEGIVLLGGTQSESATVMRLVSGTWTATTGSPGARYLTAMAFDAARNVAVLFGGGAVGGNDLLADTWEHSAAQGWRKVR